MTARSKSVHAGIEREDIRHLVHSFYPRVRADTRLGPIFHAHIGTSEQDWAPHIARIEAFWANVMLNERAYHGNPMGVHQAIPEIEGDDFAIWLDLFSSTATDVLPPAKAEVFDTLARRIGRSLKMGVERTAPNRPPDLSA